MDTKRIRNVDISQIHHLPMIDFIGNDFAIFNDIKDMPLSSYPTRLNAACLTVCLKGWCKLELNQERIPKSRKEDLFERFIRAVSESYKEERSVSYYADKMFLTAKHLSTVVKEISGKTAGEWIDSLVVLEAKALLKSSEMSIQEIADELHFANQSFFGKYFKHHTGMSPKEYRRQ